MVCFDQNSQKVTFMYILWYCHMRVWISASRIISCVPTQYGQWYRPSCRSALAARNMSILIRRWPCYLLCPEKKDRYLSSENTPKLYCCLVNWSFFLELVSWMEVCYHVWGNRVKMGGVFASLGRFGIYFVKYYIKCKVTGFAVV